VETQVFIGVLAEISMKAKLLNLRLGRDPDCVEDVIWELEKLEGDLMDAVCEFDDDGDT
jgi:hypothetical protein